MTSQVLRDMERRCPRLGSAVNFAYCLDAGETPLPCFKICDCWWEYFDVVDCLKRTLSEQDFKNLMQTRPKPKLTSLLQLIEQAQKRSRIGD